ncbi:MAG TPA: rhombosortase [Candidatus Acidoferrum sp.]|nr:rhombosortase [Candidatus Acidoferrum sp.]
MSATIQRSKSGARQFPTVSLLLLSLALLAWFMPGWAEAWQWQRDEPWQLWRWFTGHVCHWSADHLVWDAVVCIILGAWCEMRNRRSYVVLIGVSATAITLVVSLLCPQLSSYRGLSGIDSALFGWLVAELFVEALRRKDPRTLLVVTLMAGAFLVKTAFEISSQATLFVSGASSFVPVPLAHIVGFVTGWIVVFLRETGSWRFLLSHIRRPRNSPLPART